MSIRGSLRRFSVAFVTGSVLLAGVAAPAAFAADDTNVTVTGGSLSITAPVAGDLAGVTLDGTAKTTTASFAGFSATDARGTGAGWNVTVQATQFTEYADGAYVAGGKTLALNSLSLAAPTVAANGTASAAPSITAGPYSVDAASAVKIASAAADTGMGAYDFTQAGTPLTLSIPASAYAKTYRSDVTVSIVTGP